MCYDVEKRRARHNNEKFVWYESGQNATLTIETTDAIECTLAVAERGNSHLVA